ncbi:MAG: 50S ribosomal protein L20 [Candidatus Peribacteria bacterium]|nr:MAG: 50S ribosomal protein L20 [Candidatus Peribacteria bacterium]
MVRVSNGYARHRKHRKLVRQAKGFSQGRGNVYKQVRLALIKQGQNAYIGRKEKKREFRKLWIERLNAVLREKGSKYSVFVGTARAKHIDLDRKTLSNIAVVFPEVFDKIYDKVMK